MKISKTLASSSVHLTIVGKCTLHYSNEYREREVLMHLTDGNYIWHHSVVLYKLKPAMIQITKSRCLQRNESILTIMISAVLF